ncbi:acyl-CoA dehydratase activase [Acidobacteriota bacterium]
MNVAGIDCGAKTIKVLILSDGGIAAKSSVSSGFDQKAAAENAYHMALEKAGLQKEDVSHITATGAGKEEATFAPSTVTEVGADAKAVHHLYPSARTVIDVGAEGGRAIRINQEGKFVDFAINDKCAAGAGTFIETMALALEINMEEMGSLSLSSDREVSMKAQCAVFAESEVVSLIHANYSKADIARAVHDAIADRIASMARKVGIEKDVVLVGGMSRNIGFVKSLERILKEDVLIPDDPEFSCAHGAALVAAERAERG